MGLGFVWFSRDGRIGRRDYWLRGMIPVVVAALVVWTVAAVLNYFAEVVGDLFAVLPSLFLTYIFAMVSIKRWHDLDKTGWLCLLQFIPFLGIAVTVGLGLLKGQEGRNRYERM